MQRPISTRLLRRLLLAVGTVGAGTLAGCVGTIQRELEILFAPEAIQNALLIRGSILYEVFGEFLYKLLELRP